MAVTSSPTSKATSSGKVLPVAKEVMDDYDLAKNYKQDWIEQAKSDYRFVVGDQWDEKDKGVLTKAGKPALTLNKIQPLIFLISGTQRQNRSDFKAFPIGEEDSIKADAVTFLLKDMVRYCDGEYKLSEAFEDGIICGEGWIEPYIDYSDDLINGNLKFRKRMPVNVFRDPASKEYDNSDAKFLIVETPNISLDQLIELFPDKEEDLKELPINTKPSTSGGKINEYDRDYPRVGEYRKNESLSKEYAEQLPYQMIEYHHYEYRSVFLLANPHNQQLPVQKFNSKKEADAAYAEAIEVLGEGNEESVKIVKRYIPVPRVKIVVNEIEIDDFESPFYPRYKKIPVFSFYAHWLQAPIDKHELLTQGIVNSLKDPQTEINKRRSQELHHLNSSTNSGWLSRKRGGIVNKGQVEKYGASSGFILEYEKEKPERIFPMPLSTGHEQLAQLANADIKEISGINTDLLAQNDKASSSGRAIHLRQQQGIMMIQRILDNFSRTKREMGRFLISQIGEVYDMKKAKRAIGESWIRTHFEKPVLQPRKNPADGSVMMNQQTGKPDVVPVMGEDGKMEMEMDTEGLDAFFQMVLNDASMDRYDVVVGEVATSETIKMSNYTMLNDLMKSGIPIPPDVIVQESMLNEQTKQKISKSIAAAQQAAAKQPAK